MEKFTLESGTECWEAECDLDCLPALFLILEDIQTEELEGAFTENFGIEAFSDGHISILVTPGTDGLAEATAFLATKGITIS